MKKGNRGFFIAIIVILAILGLSMLMSNAGNGKEIAYDGGTNGESLKDYLVQGKVQRLYVSEYKVCVLLKDSKIVEDYFPKYYDYFCIIPHSSNLENDVYNTWGVTADKLPEKISYSDPTQGNWIWIVLPILGVVVVTIVLVFMFRGSMSSNNKAMNFGKNRARVIVASKVRFSDVAGEEEEKEELKEIVEFLKYPKKFTELGARIPKGVLLVGPPGTGKTLFAKAVAGEAGVPFFSISGSDFVEMFVGVGASRVRDMFDQAKRNMPCIVFIDEIDAVGRQRGAGLGGGNDEREQTLNQLLVEMDGFENNQGIIVMAATNRADVLDPALLRPGRFDRQIFVNIPDVAGREAIMRVHTRNKPIGPDVNFKVVARMTSGFSGADIENLLNEAAILAARANRKFIIMEDILEGINKVIAGPKKKSRIVTETDKRITAYHESGHAIIGKLLKNCDQVQEVSIIPRGMAAGYTLTRPETDDNHIGKGKLLDMITMMLGGRAAEQLVIKDISTGASNDIQRASDIARKMVTEWGMSEEIGNIYLGASQEVFLGRDFQTQHQYSEQISGKIDVEIKKIVDEAYKRALEILSANRTILDNMVKVLFEKETIFTEEVTALIEGKSADEVCAMVDKRIASYSKEPQKPVEQMIVKENPQPTAAETPVAAETPTATAEPEKAQTEAVEKAETEKPSQDGENENK